MPWLVLGVVIFFGVHLLPSAPKLREAARARVGARAYQGLYALVALVVYAVLLYAHGWLFGPAIV